MEKETTIITGLPQLPGFLAARDAAANAPRFDPSQQDEDAAAKAEKAAFARAARKQAEDEEEKKGKPCRLSVYPAFRCALPIYGEVHFLSSPRKRGTIFEKFEVRSVK